MKLRIYGAFREGGNAGEFYPVRHDIGQKHNMPGINMHAIRPHGKCDLMHDCLASRFNSKGLLHLNDVI